jgi:hypothetical protein
MREQLSTYLLRQLTAEAVQRWGPERAAELADALASTAETLALVAAVEYDLDEAEPDPGVPTSTDEFRL